MPDPTDHAGVLAWLRACRAEQGVSTPDYDAILAENARLRRLDAERRAMREGQRAYAQRMAHEPPSPPWSTPGDHFPPCTPQPDEFSWRVSIYSRIALAATQRGLAEASRLYDVLQHRARAQRGNAVFTVAEATEYAAALDMDRGKVIRAIKPGTGVFWELDQRSKAPDRRRRTYVMRSKENVCRALGLDSAGPRVDLPDRAYREGLDVYKAHCYSAFWHGQEQRQYARATLAQVWRVSKQTLRQWEQVAGITVQQQTAEARVPSNELEADELQRNLTARRWLTVYQTRRRRGRVISAPVMTTGLLNSDNQPLPTYSERLEYTIREAQRSGDRELCIVWQDVNAYLPGNTRLSAGARSRHIKRHLEHPKKMASAQGGNRPHDLPRRFGSMVDAVTYQSRKRDKTAKAYAGYRSPPRRFQRWDAPARGVYAHTFLYSYLAAYDFATLPALRQARVLWAYGVRYA